MQSDEGYNFPFNLHVTLTILSERRETIEIVEENKKPGKKKSIIMPL